MPSYFIKYQPARTIPQKWNDKDVGYPLAFTLALHDEVNFVIALKDIL